MNSVSQAWTRYMSAGKLLVKPFSWQLKARNIDSITSCPLSESNITAHDSKEPRDLGLFQKLPWGGGANTFFVLWGEGVLLTVCPRGGGWGVTCPGGQGIFDP